MGCPWGGGVMCSVCRSPFYHIVVIIFRLLVFEKFFTAMYTGHTWLKIWRAVYVCVLFCCGSAWKKNKKFNNNRKRWGWVAFLTRNPSYSIQRGFVSFRQFFFFLTGTKIVLRAVSGRSAVASRWLRCAEPSSLSWILLLKHRWSRIHILPFALFSFALKLIAYIYHLSSIIYI